MASVAKWLRQWIVVPPFVGSSPIVRPLAETLEIPPPFSDYKSERTRLSFSTGFFRPQSSCLINQLVFSSAT